MTKHFTTLLILVFVSAGIMQGQISPISITYNSSTVVSPDTFSPGDSVHYFFVLNNLDSLNSVNTSASYRQKLPPSSTVYTLFTDTLTILPGDTANIGFSEVVQSGKYAGGVNVLVIWPDAPAISSTDTIVVEVFYKDTTDNIPPGLAGNYDLKVFPKPSKGSVKLQSKAPAHIINDLVLYTPDGKLVKHLKYLPEQLDLSTLPDGIYHLAVRLKDGSAMREKILLMK
ncbi:MAG: T9SS type A sorting domain-containing protein [Bacteroidia bacterium]|nr:T9SS type A sorting domain-containing protein [Bacteroidia bacterium]